MIVVGTVRECEVVRRLLASAVHRLGPDAPDELRSPTFAVIAAHSPSSAATVVALADHLVHDRPMTYAEVARAADVSTSTVGRRVADGTLDKVGRRITASSVRRWVEAHDGKREVSRS